MEQLIRADQRFTKSLGWLTARWHFSFADYHDPANSQFGPLRVFNDDLIAPGGGFPDHPHRDMEIVSYVLEGALEHRDSSGGSGVIRPGQVQVMSAGTGIVHSESNPLADETTRLTQIWLLPRRAGNPPRWAERAFDPADRRGRWLPVASGREANGALSIDQDATVYVSNLKPGESLVHGTEPGRRLYLFWATGSGSANGHELSHGDQLRLSEVTDLAVVAAEESELVLIDLP